MRGIVPHQNGFYCWEVVRRWEEYVSVFDVVGILGFPFLGFHRLKIPLHLGCAK